MAHPDSYLQNDPEGTYTEQVTRLLRDTESDNAPLILELLEGGGVNARLLGYLFGFSVFHSSRQVSSRAMAMLQKHASEATVHQASKLRESAAYHYDEAEYFSRYQSEEIDLFDLLLASKMCLWHRNRPEKGSNTEAAFQTLDLRRLEVNSVSPALRNLNFLKFLALPAHKRFDLPATIPLLLDLPLEVLIIENIRIDTFPVALLGLPNLKTFIIRKGNLRPRQPMEVPEGGPHGSAGLEKLIVEAYPMTGEENLGRFPSLQEATLPRCQLSRLDFLAKSTKLERLNIRYNQLEELPAFLSDLVHLRSLELSNNPFKKIELDLERLQNLEELELKMQSRLPGNFKM